MRINLLKKCLGLAGAVVESAREEHGDVIVRARPRKAAPRCPACGRRCRPYDRLPARRWRTLDLGASRCYMEHAPLRVECPEHGVRTEAVPWARCVSSRFTSAFEDEVAWLALHMCRSALAAFLRVDWHTADGICARVEAVNNKIKVAVRQGYGFRNIDNLIALVMLRCSDLKPMLQGRTEA